MKGLCLFSLVIIFMMAIAVPATGEKPQKDPSATVLAEAVAKEKLKNPEKRVSCICIEKARTKEEVGSKKGKKKEAVAYYKDGFFIDTPDKRFRLRMTGSIHFDTRLFGGSESSRLIRYSEGQLYPKWPSFQG